MGRGSKKKSKIETAVKRALTRIKRGSFKGFLEGPFSSGFENLEGEDYITWDDGDSFPFVLADALENHEQSVTIGPRDFGKTLLFIAYALRAMIIAEKRMRIYYISYKQEQAEDFIEKFAKPIAKESALIRTCFHNDFTRKKTEIDVTNPKGYQCIMEPMGLMGAVRSKHADLLLVDDPLKVSGKVGETGTPKEIKRATKRFMEDALPLVKDRGGQCHVVGTAMAKEDLLHQLIDRETWYGNVVPAVKNIEWSEDKKRIVGGTSSWPKRWPSAKNFNKQLNRVGLKAFRKEWLCEIGREVDSYLDPQFLDNCFGYTESHGKDKKDLRMVGGHDPAKKVHPAHAIILRVDDDGELWEWEEQWMDGWDYREQLEWWRDKFSTLPIIRGYYDHQNKVFEGFDEQGLVPSAFEPHPMNFQHKMSMASELEDKVNREEIHFRGAPGCRTHSQLLAVGQDMKATETREGHGEPFTSVGLAVMAGREVDTLYSAMANAEHQLDSNKKLRGESKWDI